MGTVFSLPFFLGLLAGWLLVPMIMGMITRRSAA